MLAQRKKVRSQPSCGQTDSSMSCVATSGGRDFPPLEFGHNDAIPPTFQHRYFSIGGVQLTAGGYTPRRLFTFSFLLFFFLARGSTS